MTHPEPFIEKRQPALTKRKRCFARATVSYRSYGYEWLSKNP